jgi:hypothetical protein
MAKGVPTLLELSLRVLGRERYGGRAYPKGGCPTRGRHAPQWRAIKVSVKYVAFIPVLRSPVHEFHCSVLDSVSSLENVKNKIGAISQ